ncbi:MAG: ATP-dependent zinc metalloprotease FtsH [bacterium]
MGKMASRGDRNNTSPSSPINKSPFFWLALLMIASLFLLPRLFNTSPEGKEISWQQFKTHMLDTGAVEKLVVVNNERVDVFIKKNKLNDPEFSKDVKKSFDNSFKQGPHYWFTIGSVETFENKIEEAQKKIPENQRVQISYERYTNSFPGILNLILPLLLLFLLWRMLSGRLSSMGGSGPSIFNFGKSNARLIEKEATPITFEDVAGLEEAEMEVKEIVEFLKSPEKFTRVGAKIPKGIILVGPPGTGKTLLAKAVAGEAQVPFFSISGSAFVEMFVGVGASRVRDLFKTAKERTPCIVFIDEIDAIGRSRGKGAYLSGSNDERESTLNQLLTEMDGFDTNSGVIVLAATNRADLLDPALLRPGRFDRHIYLELPNVREREEILKVHIKKLLLGDDVDLKILASQTPGFSGADIANICNEAALITARSGKDKIGKTEFFEAIDRIVAGLEKKSKIISPKEKLIIAHHEAGHAVASWLLKNVDPLLKISIIPRGKSLGAAWYLPEEKSIRSESAFNEHLSATLAGRAAEELIFGEVSSGALDDLEKVTKEAYTMVVYYGFSKKIGPVSFYDSTGLSQNGFVKPYSEETGKLMDEEVRLLISTSYERTKQLLAAHKDELVRVAELLLNKEVVYKEDIEKILGKREEAH